MTVRKAQAGATPPRPPTRPPRWTRCSLTAAAASARSCCPRSSGPAPSAPSSTTTIRCCAPSRTSSPCRTWATRPCRRSGPSARTYSARSCRPASGVPRLWRCAGAALTWDRSLRSRITHRSHRDPPTSNRTALIRPVSTASSATAMTCPLHGADRCARPRSPDDDPSPGWLAKAQSHAGLHQRRVCEPCPDLNVGRRE